MTDLIKGLEEAGLPPTPRATANQKPAWDHLQKIEWRTARAWMCPFVHNVCTCTDTDLFGLTCVYQCVCVCACACVCVCELRANASECLCACLCVGRSQTLIRPISWVENTTICSPQPWAVDQSGGGDRWPPGPQTRGQT